MLPPVFIWVRAEVDWDDVDGLAERLDPAFVPKLAVWNATFAIPYHAFRSELCRIARLNHSRVVGATSALWDEIPDGALVVPVDDDDWFSPELVAVLRARHDPRATAYRWSSSFLEVPTTLGHYVYLARRAAMPRTPPKYFCTTNNYALVKRPGARPLAENHVRASEALPADPEVCRVEARLSLMNRTLASQTTLTSQRTLLYKRPDVTRAHLLRKYARYRRLYRSFDLEGLEWAAEYVEAMAGLMERLAVRREVPR